MAHHVHNAASMAAVQVNAAKYTDSAQLDIGANYVWDSPEFTYLVLCPLCTEDSEIYIHH